MSGLGDFLQLGGYAVYVWPAYGVAALVLGGLLTESLSRLRRVERRLAALEASDAPQDDAA
ncbi:MAG: heme exporter protein CcmD [Alphaproteobacteria bacterium]|nr:heme exporter protein CcmD [Alphaproteobacteria bacterium]